MSGTTKKPVPAIELVPVTLITDWWDGDGVRYSARETVKVTVSVAAQMVRAGIALESEK